MGAIHIEDPGAPFHHIGLPLGATPSRIGIEADGRKSVFSGSQNCFSVIEAGVAGTSWWDGPLEAACFYFTSESLSVALGDQIDDHIHDIRTTASFHAPAACRLLHALRADAARGQPHGVLVGDAIFIALAALLAPSGVEWRGRVSPGAPDWRVSRALEFIHAHLTDRLDIASISEAAGSSPFHLSRLFAQTMQVSICRYVLRERARYAFALLNDPKLTLTQISNAAGFETYPSFIAAMRSEFGQAPSILRKASPR